MQLNEYQSRARSTRQKPAMENADLMVPLLGLAGEVGELLNEYKKYLRDGDAHQRFDDRVAEELGDLLWYLADTASKFGLELEAIAARNLEKTAARWGGASGYMKPRVFDSAFPDAERIPRKFVADFRQLVGADKSRRIRVFVNGKQMGQELTDNAYQDDGYRFHDVFHLACAAVLGWSPVTRRNLGCKRRSKPLIDEVEDGGRAIVTEEGVSAYVFAYAKDHDAMKVKYIDYDLLKSIRVATAQFEVGVCTTGEWERAILLGYEVWREVEVNQGGKVRVDLDRRLIEYVGMGEYAESP